MSGHVRTPPPVLPATRPASDPEPTIASCPIGSLPD